MDVGKVTARPASLSMGSPQAQTRSAGLVLDGPTIEAEFQFLLSDRDFIISSNAPLAHMAEIPYDLREPL